MAKDVFNLVGQTLASKYAIEAQVAAGGFGVVYRARHTELETPAAVKVLHVTRGADEVSRARFLKEFKQEAQLVARLSHPAIARVLDFGVAEMPDKERAPWMALEWVEGRTLKDDLVERRGKGGRSPAECLALLRPILEALAHAHEEGVVHRDIKPANMILTAPRAAHGSLDGRPRRAAGVPMRLLDFGIAKIMRPDEELPSGETSTSAEALQFTTAYAAPEQVGGKRTGPWTDVHALALVLVEMLSDQRAYPGTDNVELLRHIVALERPTPARRFGLDVGAWEPVLARALASSPAERYPDAGEFLAALEANVPASVGRLSAAPEVSLSTLDVSAGISVKPVVTVSTEVTSTTSPSVSDMRPPRPEPVAPAPWHAQPRVRYGALGVVTLGVLGLVAAFVWPRAPENTASPALRVATPAARPVETRTEAVEPTPTPTPPTTPAPLEAPAAVSTVATPAEQPPEHPRRGRRGRRDERRPSSRRGSSHASATSTTPTATTAVATPVQAATPAAAPARDPITAGPRAE